MRFGVTLFPTDETIDAVELGREAEARGLDSIWFPEHTHIPVSRRTPPPTGEAVLAEEYRRCLDPLVALAAVAGATSRIRLGTGIALVSQREPIVTAKAVASLDLLSGGRFALGIGFGWNVDEMEDHGVAHRTRRDHARDHVLAMRRLWEDDEASYEGEFVRFPPTWSWPKPVQRPLPVLIGGMAGPKLFAHIAEYAQGWIPIGGAGLTAAIPTLRAAVEAAGRDPETLEIIPFGSIPDEGKLDHFEKIGVTEVVMRLPAAPRDVVLPILDKQAALVASRR
ncbi:MAG TPA: LLM class F420-dependent oxidoreductase [Acidimicrobiales bacterium]|nr:LLM class F420-dependent oxidoreductase [Acidimicrobiales bacterium]